VFFKPPAAIRQSRLFGTGQSAAYKKAYHPLVSQVSHGVAYARRFYDRQVETYVIM